MPKIWTNLEQISIHKIFQVTHELLKEVLTKETSKSWSRPPIDVLRELQDRLQHVGPPHA